MKTEKQLSNLSGKIKCEEPNFHFNSFAGTLYLNEKRYHFFFRLKHFFVHLVFPDNYFYSHSKYKECFTL